MSRIQEFIAQAVSEIPSDLTAEPRWPAAPLRDEPARLAALHRYHLLDTAFEESFDHLTRWARDRFGVPIALISLVDANRQWFKSACGLDIRETPRDVAFCNYTILHGRPMVVEDALEDDRFRDNALVTGYPGIRFYAGAPIITADGYGLGTVCLIDHQPRKFDLVDRVLLSKLAEVAMAEIEQRESLTREAEAETTG